MLEFGLIVMAKFSWLLVFFILTTRIELGKEEAITTERKTASKIICTYQKKKF